jgi:hypothetical protein
MRGPSSSQLRRRQADGKLVDQIAVDAKPKLVVDELGNCRSMSTSHTYSSSS